MQRRRVLSICCWLDRLDTAEVGFGDWWSRWYCRRLCVSTSPMTFVPCQATQLRHLTANACADSTLTAANDPPACTRAPTVRLPGTGDKPPSSRGGHGAATPVSSAAVDASSQLSPAATSAPGTPIATYRADPKTGCNDPKMLARDIQMLSKVRAVSCMYRRWVCAFAVPWTGETTRRRASVTKVCACTSGTVTSDAHLRMAVISYTPVFAHIIMLAGRHMLQLCT